MILGGISYYLDYFIPSFSLAQNVDNLFFGKRPKLGDEFERLFNSIFDHAEDCMRIVRTLARRHAGYTREDLSRLTGLAPNGEFTKMMKALMGSDFVVKYTPFGESRKTAFYRLSDCFCWFWLHFKEKKRIVESDYWQHHLKESEVRSWCGVAFEEVCLQHVPQIKSALQIAGVSSVESSLVVRGGGDTDGMQIDLLIDRADDVVNVCEMKYYSSPFTVTKSYADTLRHRLAALESEYPNKTFNLTLVSSEPMRQNEYAGLFASTVGLDELFL